MPAPWSFINFDAEDAFKAYIEATDKPDPARVYVSAQITGEDEAMEEPCVAVSCKTSGPPDGSDVGLASSVSNQTLDISLYIRTHAANEDVLAIGQKITAREYHKQLVGRMLDIIRRSDLPQALNDMQIPNIVFEFFDMPTITTSAVDRAYVTEIALRCQAYPKADQ